MNKIIVAICGFSCGLLFNVWGQEDNESELEEINAPEKTKQNFSLSDLFSNFNVHAKQKTESKAKKEKRDCFAEDRQAFAEDDPWDKL